MWEHWGDHHPEELGNCVKLGLDCYRTDDFTKLPLSHIPFATVYYFWVVTPAKVPFLKKFSDYAAVAQRKFRILCFLSDLNVLAETNEQGWHTMEGLQELFPGSHVDFRHAAQVHQDKGTFHKAHDGALGAVFTLLVIEVNASL